MNFVDRRQHHHCCRHPTARISLSLYVYISEITWNLITEILINNKNNDKSETNDRLWAKENERDAEQLENNFSRLFAWKAK